MPIKNPFAAAPPAESDLGDDMWGLSRTQRMYGFGICFLVGVVISFMSTIFLSTGSIIAFGVIYTFGNIVCLLSTSFLVGPGKQLKTAFAKTRVGATIIYLVSMGATLFCAIFLHSVLLTLICCIVQFCALLWYSLSYIPYARTLVKNMVGRGAGGAEGMV